MPKNELRLAPQEVEERLRQLGELYAFAMELRTARWVGPVRESVTKGPGLAGPLPPNRDPEEAGRT